MPAPRPARGDEAGALAPGSTGRRGEEFPAAGEPGSLDGELGRDPFAGAIVGVPGQFKLVSMSFLSSHLDLPPDCLPTRGWRPS